MTQTNRSPSALEKTKGERHRMVFAQRAMATRAELSSFMECSFCWRSGFERAESGLGCCATPEFAPDFFRLGSCRGAGTERVLCGAVVRGPRDSTTETLRAGRGFDAKTIEVGRRDRTQLCIGQRLPEAATALNQRGAFVRIGFSGREGGPIRATESSSGHPGARRSVPSRRTESPCLARCLRRHAGTRR